MNHAHRPAGKRCAQPSRTEHPHAASQNDKRNPMDEEELGEQMPRSLPQPKANVRKAKSSSGRISFSRIRRISRKKLGAIIGAVFTLIIAPIVVSIATTGEIPFLHSHKAPSATVRIIYDPWTIENRFTNDIRIASKLHGYCWRESNAAPRLNAYRCVARNQILDPCFNDPFGTVSKVVCAFPSASAVTVLNLTRPLPVFSASASLSRPWLLVLADGTHCYFTSGGNPSPSGLLLDYRCPNGWLYGEIDQTKPIWKIIGQFNDSSTMNFMNIFKAYY